MILCRLCGAENPGTVDNCGSCGSALGIRPSSPPVQPAATASADLSVLAPVGAPAGAYRVARMRDRLAAAILDSTLLIAAYVMTGMLAASKIQGVVENGHSLLGARTVFVIALGVAAAVVYFWLCEGLFGATLGKALAGIQ